MKKCLGSGKLPNVEFPLDNRFRNGWVGIGSVLHHCPDGCGRFWQYNDNNSGWSSIPVPVHYIKGESPT